eukprot:COSAG02_NODE_60_length_43475_cov_59.494582_11_plen_91_part_00
MVASLCRRHHQPVVSKLGEVVISDEHGRIDATGSYHGGSDLLVERIKYVSVYCLGGGHGSSHGIDWAVSSAARRSAMMDGGVVVLWSVSS